jgi:hypothetical protein
MKKTIVRLVAVTIVLTVLISMWGCELNNNQGDGNQELTRKDSLCLMLLYKIKPDSIGQKINELSDLGTRFALASNRRTVALVIRDMFRKAGYDNASIDSFQANTTWNEIDYPTWQYNVTAELVGSVHPDSVNIVGAHYDALITDGDPFQTTPGANDNASGVAGLIEVARVMKYTGYNPAISIRFVAFAGQEVGLLGSNDYAEKLTGSGKTVNIMINMDMIAHTTSTNYQLWTMKIVFNQGSYALANGTSTLCSQYIGIYALGDSVHTTNSDIYPFYTKGYRAMEFTSGDTDVNDHTTLDIANNCNQSYSSLITGLSCVVLVYHD